MAYNNLAFCWNGVISTDVQKSVNFFTEAIGWGSMEVDMGGEPTTMLTNNGVPFAHVRSPQMKEEPSWWNNYLRVEDVDAAVATIEANGGKVLVPATDIPPGRFATVTSPSGAYFSVFHEADASSTNVEQGTGSITWTDLHSKDLDADLKLLTALGLKTNVMQMPAGPYTMFDNGTDGQARSGAMAGMNPQAPSMWLAWVDVESADDTLTRVTNNGGKIVAPAWEAPGVGKMAIASDPAGVVFGVIQSPDGDAAQQS